MTESRRPVEDVRMFLETMLRSAGARDAHARQVADVLLEADMRGIYSHGIARLPRYLKAAASGEIDVAAEPEAAGERGAAVRVDARHGFGQVAGVLAMDRAIDAAERFGLGMATVRDSNHFGIAAYYAERALPRGMIGVAMTNTAPLVVPTGGKRAVLGTNPIAAAVPYGDDGWLMDFSTSAVSRGKIEVHDRARLPLEPGWAVGGNGEPCTDAGEALRILANRLDGGIAPMADYKGYGLAALVDVLCGVLSGSGFGAEVGGGGPGNVGHCFLAVDVAHFFPRDRFDASMRAFCSALTGSAAPGKQVYLHGEKERNARRESLTTGILVPAETDALLRKAGAEKGVEW